MVADVGGNVHPWYKGNHQWKVKAVAQLEQPVKYHDDQQGDVSYDPKIMLLEGLGGCSVLWFNYWISTDKTGHKPKWGGGPPIIEEYVFLDLMRKAIRSGLFSEDLLVGLAKELEKRPK